MFKFSIAKILLALVAVALGIQNYILSQKLKVERENHIQLYAGLVQKELTKLQVKGFHNGTGMLFLVTPTFKQFEQTQTDENTVLLVAKLGGPDGVREWLTRRANKNTGNAEPARNTEAFEFRIPAHYYEKTEGQ